MRFRVRRTCTAAARGKPEDALRRAREALAHADALGISFGTMRWASLRENSTPYHLAHGLLDHAGYLTRHGHPDACRPLLDRADALERAQPVLGV